MRKEKRPNIELITSATELKRWYWLKSELVAHARSKGVKASGGKFLILERLAYFLDTGKPIFPGDKKPVITSKFDWHTEVLTPHTRITDSYKNSQNVRRFFKQQLGKDFKFNIAFMEWIKGNAGKSLADAVDEYSRQAKQVLTPGFQTKIKPHNQFNQYTRDILTANPSMNMGEVRRIWELKRALPSQTGQHLYETSDLYLEE